MTVDEAAAGRTAMIKPKPDDNVIDDEKQLTIIEHLDELRQRLVWSVLAIGVGTAISFVFARPLFEILMRPARILGLDFKPIFVEMTEMLGTYFKVALFGGLILAMPVLVYQLIAYIAPALTRKEKRYLYYTLPPIFVCFLAGVIFGYFVLLPPAVTFLLTFGGDIAQAQIRISDYVGTVTKLLFWIGVSFETPLVIFVLAKLHLVTPKRLASYRRYAFVIAFVLGAFITPTFDPINQTLVAMPLIVLYEIGIWLAKLA